MKSNKMFFLNNFSLVILSSFLFALSHPNYITASGLPFLAYFTLIPLFILIKRIDFKFSFLWGCFFGGFSYFIFNLWMMYFHPVAIFVVVIQYAILFTFLFPILKIVYIYFKKWNFLFVAIVWIAFEYVKTLGFMGYPYGIMGYTQWSFTYLIQVSSIFGVWGISFILVLCSSLLTEILANIPLISARLKIYKRDTNIKFYQKAFTLWLGVFIAFILYGFFVQLRSNADEKANVKKIALVQPNRDPWLGNIEVYRHNFEELKSLSKKALDIEPKLDLIVWPETAFIPRIRWHYKYSTNSNSTILVRDLLAFINNQGVPFLIGNDDAVYDESLSDGSDFESGRVDYNASLLFFPKKNTMPPEPEIYRKRHLVPFTEHFPYKNIFPRFYNLLLESDTHFWTKGSECKIFDLNGVKFSTPICFEDCFGYISRDFVRNGADIIINITNDAWAESLVSQYQHFSMAVFRAVENRVPVLRSAVSGQTAYIDRNGNVVSMLQAFSPDVLIVEVPIAKNKYPTIYSTLGDFFAILCLCISIVLLLIVLTKKIKVWRNYEK